MVLWWIANVVLLIVVVPLVVVLANRVIRSATEITNYAEDIREHAGGIAGNLEPVPALLDTRELVRTAAGHAAAYAGVLERRLAGGR